MDAKSILKKGLLKMKVKAQGILQMHTFKVESEKSPFGPVPFLISEQELPEMELIRIARETDLPVKCGSLKVFPPGKMPKDIAAMLK